MTAWVDFAEIRERVSLEQVLLEFYGLENLKRDGAKLIGPCPVHNGDSKRAFHADLAKNVWHCFTGCRRGGNQLDLVALKENISIRDAAIKLKAFFHLSDSETSANAPRASPTPKRASAANLDRTPTSDTQNNVASNNNLDATDTIGADSGGARRDHINPPLDVVLDLKPDHPHLLHDRGFALATVERFGVGYCHRGIMRGCLAIPIRDEEGELVAYAGRRLKPKDVRELGKYKLPKGFRKDRVLYNLNQAKEYAAAGLILVEGFFSVLKLYEAGFPNTVASMGCALSDAQADLLARTADETIILYDGNDAGWNGAVEAKTKLEARQTIVRVVRLPENTEPDDLSPKAIRWLANGMTSLDLAEVTLGFRKQGEEVSP